MCDSVRPLYLLTYLLVLQPPPSAWQPLNWLGFGQSWNSYVVDAPAGRELHCYGS